MCDIWTVVISVSVILFIIILIFNCKRCIKEYKYIRELASPVPNQIYPISTGIEVDNIDENIQVITINEYNT